MGGPPRSSGRAAPSLPQASRVLRVWARGSSSTCVDWSLMKPQFPQVSGNASPCRSTASLPTACSSVIRSSQPCQSSLRRTGMRCGLPGSAGSRRSASPSFASHSPTTHAAVIRPVEASHATRPSRDRRASAHARCFSRCRRARSIPLRAADPTAAGVPSSWSDPFARLPEAEGHALVRECGHGDARHTVAQCRRPPCRANAELRHPSSDAHDPLGCRRRSYPSGFSGARRSANARKAGRRPLTRTGAAPSLSRA